MARSVNTDIVCVEFKQPDSGGHQDLKTEIEAAYSASENRLGWRLLYSPAEVLNGADVAFIGLNPGGNSKTDDHVDFAMPNGSAYRDESWKGRPPGQEVLQQQVLSLFARLCVEPDQVLAGNLVPFRSHDWKSLENKTAALEFGRKIWARIFADANPTRVVAMGKLATKEVGRIIGVEQLDWR
jgi:hypothetical protein